MNTETAGNSARSRQADRKEHSVAVVGMGYVGLTFASMLAQHGYNVQGIEKNQRVREGLQRKELHLLEPGIGDLIKKHIGGNWTVSEEYLCAPDVAVICVSTPINDDGVPDLTNISDACCALQSKMNAGGLVIVRSTVPVGTTRNVVFPHFKGRNIHIAFCPERTIQGQALRELTELPQVIGGLDAGSRMAADSFFAPMVKKRMLVGSLEAAEMVKLVNNCHTDVLYSYGNEVALMAKEFGLDPLEVIDAANIDYPRPDLARPGFVGGACLTKDPYILAASFGSSEKTPKLILSARELNERMPTEVAKHLADLIRRKGKKSLPTQILVCGFAYKGVPETDDMRGSPVDPFLHALRAECACQVMGHDFVVTDDVIASFEVEAVSLEEGFRRADGVIFLNNHKRYGALDLKPLLLNKGGSFVVYDCWRIFAKNPVIPASGIQYAGIGYEAL